jgi:hypothetical protein
VILRASRLARSCLLLPLFAASALSCADTNSAQPACEDGVDNDGDGYFDENDPSCIVGHPDEGDDPITDCNDGEDDDEDGLTDLDDPGCSNPADDSEVGSGTPACKDGEDNDGDGKVDYPADPGCSNPLQNNEADGCPDGPCPQCADGEDNDGDGKTDYPADPGCNAASDNQEITSDPTACAGMPFMPMPEGGVASGMFMSGNGMLNTMCGGETALGAGREQVYELFLESPKVVVATTDLSSTTANTVLYIRESCGDAASELACNDDARTGATGSTITVALDAGYYYVVVDNKNTATAGNVQLRVDLFPGVGTACDPEADAPCAPGLVCRSLEGASAPTCEEPVCDDGRDDDADGITDFPLDPGCESPGDTTEDDDCPDGTSCPACADGIDNDGDGLVDYPMDTACRSASQDIEACGMEEDPIVMMTSGSHSGTLVGAHDNFQPVCGGTGGFEIAHLFTLTVPVETLEFDTNDSAADTILVVDDPSCDNQETQCDDEGGEPFGASKITLTDPAPGQYVAFVGAYSTFYNDDTYNLHVKGTVAPLAACTDPGFAAGYLVCPTGYVCDGAICQPPACSDTLDQDSDGHVGFPADPGCADALDNTEEDDCPTGPNCPACANGLDDDGDGQIDYPNDTQCTAASRASEACAIETDPIGTISTNITTGSTAGAGATVSPPSGCSFGSGGPEVAYYLTLPVPVTNLRLDTDLTLTDTVVYLDDASCDGGIDVNWCDDDDAASGYGSDVTIPSVPAGAYAVFVDSYCATCTGTFQLRIHGTAAVGAACTDPLFAAGVITCPTACNAGVCQ